MSNNFRVVCTTYLMSLRTIRANSHATDELSFRASLDTLLNEAAKDTSRPVQIIGEAKKLKSGRPDFTVTAQDLPIGYIEAEAYNIDLSRLTGHARIQNDSFRVNLDNFLLTNHLEFQLYLGGQLVHSAKLPVPEAKGPIKISDNDLEAMVNLFDRFFSGALPPITSPRDLAIHLARRTREMRKEVLSALLGEKIVRGELTETFEAFKETLLPELTPEEFADMYAQTIVYGLFAARCAAPNAKQFSRLSAASLVPKTNPFLRKMFQRIDSLDFEESIAWIADDIVQLLTLAPINDILSDFGKKTKQEDPVVHFYETFLSQYNAQIRDLRGVYYTPEPVVSFIVRSVDHLEAV